MDTNLDWLRNIDMNYDPDPIRNNKINLLDILLLRLQELPYKRAVMPLKSNNKYDKVTARGWLYSTW